MAVKREIEFIEEDDNHPAYVQLFIRTGEGLLVVATRFYFQQCCGVMEFCHFGLYPDVSEEVKTALLDAMKEVARVYHKGLMHFTLTKFRMSVAKVGVEAAGYQQSDWFVNLMKALPGVVAVPIVQNPNSFNYIEMYVWPTGVIRERIFG